MVERRSELRIVWTVIAIIGAKYLGLDFSLIFNPELAEIATTTINGVPILGEEIVKVKGENSGIYAIILGVVGVVYPACRTTLKSIDKYVKGQTTISLNSK